MQAKSNKLGGRIWFNIILFGFMGQIAWSVENMYFNTFLYNSVYNGASQNAVNGSLDVMSAISAMVAFSAATAVITTFFAGTLSDKTGKRKWFISIGYILWGIVTASFGLISRDNTASLFGLTDEVKILTATVCIVIVMDCVMTFMGSTGNDAAFNRCYQHKKPRNGGKCVGADAVACHGSCNGACGRCYGHRLFCVFLGARRNCDSLRRAWLFYT